MAQETAHGVTTVGVDYGAPRRSLWCEHGDRDLPDLLRHHADTAGLGCHLDEAIRRPPPGGEILRSGVFMPSIGEAIDRTGQLLFVDAVVPPATAPHRTSDHMKDMLDGQTVGGVLRRWLDWWPTDVIAELLPDPADRDQLAADMPQLPRSFYDIDIDVPLGWSEGPCAYLRLSPAYDAELKEAAARNWPTATLDSTHLGTRTEPDRVLDEILRLADHIN